VVTYRLIAPKKIIKSIAGKGCNHLHASSYLKLDLGSYFTEKYYMKNVFAPRMCDECGKNFGTDYKVSGKNPVYACANAVRNDHECGNAYCKDCFTATILMNFERRATNATESNKRLRR
jgi:hypothetical protein